MTEGPRLSRPARGEGQRAEPGIPLLQRRPLRLPADGVVEPARVLRAVWSGSGPGLRCCNPPFAAPSCCKSTARRRFSAVQMEIDRRTVQRFG
jgi:hypothetical protein